MIFFFVFSMTEKWINQGQYTRAANSKFT